MKSSKSCSLFDESFIDDLQMEKPSFLMSWNYHSCLFLLFHHLTVIDVPHKPKITDIFAAFLGWRLRKKINKIKWTAKLLCNSCRNHKKNTDFTLIKMTKLTERLLLLLLPAV